MAGTFLPCLFTTCPQGAGPSSWSQGRLPRQPWQSKSLTHRWWLSENRVSRTWREAGLLPRVCFSIWRGATTFLHQGRAPGLGFVSPQPLGLGGHDLGIWSTRGKGRWWREAPAGDWGAFCAGRRSGSPALGKSRWDSPERASGRWNEEVGFQSKNLTSALLEPKELPCGEPSP